MPEPSDTLAVFAEVSVALAGFSGIVIAFGKRALGSFSPLELRRLSNLFMLSGLVLVVALLGISLLHMELENPGVLWPIGSAVVLLFAVPWFILDIVRLRRLDAAEKAKVNRYVLYTFNTLVVAAVALQVANFLVLKEPWPFFVALTLAIFGAFQQFILLVSMEFRNSKSRT